MPADVECDIDVADRFQSDEEQNRMAAKIYAEFIVEGAPNQVRGCVSVCSKVFAG